MFVDITYFVNIILTELRYIAGAILYETKRDNFLKICFLLLDSPGHVRLKLGRIRLTSPNVYPNLTQKNGENSVPHMKRTCYGKVVHL